MSGYGPPRGWRGSNAWADAASQRPTEGAVSSDNSSRQAAAAQDLANLLNQIWGLGAVVVPQIDKGFEVSYSISWLSDGRDHSARVEWDYAKQQWHTLGVKREGGD